MCLVELNMSKPGREVLMWDNNRQQKCWPPTGFSGKMRIAFKCDYSYFPNIEQTSLNQSEPCSGELLLYVEVLCVYWESL